MPTGLTIGAKDYRYAGEERLEESGILLQKELFAGAVYLAGRAVESMLRAIIWKGDMAARTGGVSLDTGHDLRQLFQRAMSHGLLEEEDQIAALSSKIEYISRLWFNNMRFVSSRKLQTRWWEMKHISGKRTLKKVAREYYDVCSDVVKRCKVIL